MKLTEFIESASYLDYLDDLDDLDKQLVTKIDRNAKDDDIVIDIENKRLDYASLTTDDLAWLILNERAGTISYIVKKIIIYLEPDGGEENIVNLPPTRTFPVGHLIEYFLLLKRREDLSEYITKLRIPKAKRYIKEITAIFSEIKHKTS